MQIGACALEVPLDGDADEAARQISVREVPAERDGLVRSLNRPLLARRHGGESIRAVRDPERSQRKRRPGGRIAWIERDRLLIRLLRAPEAFHVVAAEELLPEQVLVVRLGAGGAAVLRGGRLQQFELERVDHCPGDVVLHGEDVGQRPVVRFRPEMVAVGRIDELGGDADLIA